MPTSAVKYYETVSMRKLRHPFRSKKLEKLFSEPSAQETSYETMSELDAFKADKQLAKYMKRAENGGLTPEEQENRGALLKFLQGPCDLPDELF